MGRVKDQLYFSEEIVAELESLFKRTLPRVQQTNEYVAYGLGDFRYGYGSTVSNSDTDYGDWIPYVEPCNHEWLDTGMRRTYCKHCNTRADRDMMTGEITILPPREKEK